MLPQHITEIFLSLFVVSGVLRLSEIVEVVDISFTDSTCCVAALDNVSDLSTDKVIAGMQLDERVAGPIARKTDPRASWGVAHDTGLKRLIAGIKCMMLGVLQVYTPDDGS